MLYKTWYWGQHILQSCVSTGSSRELNSVLYQKFLEKPYFIISLLEPELCSAIRFLHPMHNVVVLYSILQSLVYCGYCILILVIRLYLLVYSRHKCFSQYLDEISSLALELRATSTLRAMTRSQTVSNNRPLGHVLSISFRFYGKLKGNRRVLLQVIRVRQSYHRQYYNGL